MDTPDGSGQVREDDEEAPQRMNVEEYVNLEKVEREHWYYAGKRDIVVRWLERLGALRPESLLLDCGAGTGFFARTLRGRCRVRVLDDHPESLEILRHHFAAEEVIAATISQAALPAQSVDVVTALDVLEHVERDAAMVAEFHRVLKPGGISVVTVPASRRLWSDWDVSLHHHRRYDRAQLQAIFPAQDWEIIELKYTNSLVYPLVWLVRKWRSVAQRGGKGHAGARTEDTLPPGPLNRVLHAAFVGQALSSVSFPFGVSLLLVARKRR